MILISNTSSRRSVPNPIQCQTKTRAIFLACCAWYITSPASLLSQGCVAVTGGNRCALHPTIYELGSNHSEQQWTATLGYRFLLSDRHFSGGEEPRNAAGLDRFEQGNEVINRSHFIDLSLAYQFTPRYGASLTLPFVYHTRSAPYEHSGVRHNTTSAGIGDIRAGGNAWLWDPASNPKGNIQLGLGIKLPTGDYEASDTFYQDQDPTAALDIQPVTRNVDQSVQPGDGGWGLTMEINGYYKLTERVISYAQAYYLFNPENTNGAKSPTARRDAGPNVAGVDIDNGMAISDQYLFRSGLTYVLSPKNQLALSLGARMEGVPVEDLNGNAGDKEGFRRPGYAIAIEPGISWMPGSWNLAVSVPVLVAANREKSYWDKVKGRHGDAAFADYVINLSVSKRF